MVMISQYNWEDDSFTYNTAAMDARQIWRSAVAQIATKARQTLPEAHGRIDKAVQIVLNGDVELLADDTAKVASQSNGTTEYYVVNGTCECRDFPKAPAGWCKHRIAAGIAKRAVALAKQGLPQLDSVQNGTTKPTPEPSTLEVPAPVPVHDTSAPALPEAPASANVYVTLAGRKVQVTLRDHDEARLLTRLATLLERFPAEEEEESAPTTPPEGWCSVHQCQMKHYTKDEKSWWSHRLPNNGGWCRGK